MSDQIPGAEGQGLPKPPEHSDSGLPCGPAPTQMPEMSALAIVCFILALLGIILLPLALVALVLGIIALIRIEASKGRLTGRPFAICGIVIPVFAFSVMGLILMPALNRAREQGRRAVCLNNLKQLSLAWIMYADENDSRLVNACTVPGAEGHEDRTKEPCWLYFGGDAWTREQRITGIKDGAMWPYINQLKIYKCPTGIRGEQNTYAIVDAMNGAMDSIPGVKDLVVRKRLQVRRPGERMVYVDEGKTSTQSWRVFYDRESWWDDPPVRHGQGTSASFADGHVEYWRWQGTETIRYSRKRENSAPASWTPTSDEGYHDLCRVQRACWGKLGYSPSR